MKEQFVPDRIKRFYSRRIKVSYTRKVTPLKLLSDIGEKTPKEIIKVYDLGIRGRLR